MNHIYSPGHFEFSNQAGIYFVRMLTHDEVPGPFDSLNDVLGIAHHADRFTKLDELRIDWKGLLLKHLKSHAVINSSRVQINDFVDCSEHYIIEWRGGLQQEERWQSHRVSERSLL